MPFYLEMSKNTTQQRDIYDIVIFRFLQIFLQIITDGFFDIAIESWLEWDLNPGPLNSVQML